MDQQPSATLPSSSGLRRRTFTVEEYHRMAEAGILHPDERLELIDGEILEMSPIGGPHVIALMRLVQVLSPAVAGRAGLSVQGSLRMRDGSEPQPDLALLRPRDDEDDETTPRADEALLLIEVADSSIEYDRRTKRPLYARNGIPELWIVDLQARTVEVCRGPTTDGYVSVEAKKPGDVLGIVALPGVEVPAERIVRRRRS